MVLWKLWSVCAENRSYSTEIFLLEFESKFESDTTVPIVLQRWWIRYKTYELSPYGTSGTFQYGLICWHWPTGNWICTKPFVWNSMVTFLLSHRRWSNDYYSHGNIDLDDDEEKGAREATAAAGLNDDADAINCKPSPWFCCSYTIGC